MVKLADPEPLLFGHFFLPLLRLPSYMENCFFLGWAAVGDWEAGRFL